MESRDVVDKNGCLRKSCAHPRMILTLKLDKDSNFIWVIVWKVDVILQQCQTIPEVPLIPRELAPVERRLTKWLMLAKLTWRSRAGSPPPKIGRHWKSGAKELFTVHRVTIGQRGRRHHVIPQQNVTEDPEPRLPRGTGNRQSAQDWRFAQEPWSWTSLASKTHYRQISQIPGPKPHLGGCTQDW